MKLKRWAAVLLTVFISFNSFGICYGQDNNANDVTYYTNGVSAYSEIPASYQLDKTKFPDVRNQGKYGTCWSFAALGLSEFDLISKGMADKNIDLSELQLAYYSYNSVVDPLGGTEGDQAKYYNGSTEYSYLDRGGMYEYAVRRLSQWSGAANEKDVPYTVENINNVLNNGLDDEYAYSKNVAHLENAYKLSLKNNTDDVKKAIMNHGAVGVQYYHSDFYLLWNDSKMLWTYYDPSISGGGHNVMIVGWDDNFSKDNFVGDKPSNDGAWLIRNSWGIQQSYFWMSYENHSLMDTAWVFDMNTADNYVNNYQLDGGIDCYNVTNNICNYKTYSNVFTVQNKSDVDSENLEAVSLSFTHASNVNYKIEIYTDLKSNNPYSGTKQESATTEGTTNYAGLYTISLNDVVKLKPGTSYSVVVTTDDYALDYEQGIFWEDDGVKVWDAPVSLANGKSFYGTADYQWKWSFGNFCIKAFTTNNYAINYELDGGTNNAENPLSYTRSDDSIILKEPVKEGYSFAGWYTDSEYTNKITEISAGSTGAYTLYAKWNELLNTSIIGYTLGLKGDINLNFYIDLPDDLSDEAYVEFTDENGNVSKVNTADVEKSSEYNAFAFPYTVGAKYMTTEVSAKVIDGDRESEVYTTTVKNYIDYVLANQTESKYSSVVEVVKTLANYGAAAQIQFDYKTDNLPNSSPYISDSDKVIKDVDFSNYKDTTTNRDSVEGISYYGSSLVLLSETTIRDYFIVSDGHSIDEYVFQRELTDGTKDNITPVKAVVNGVTYYYVEAQNAKAYQLDQAVTVRVQKKDGDINSGLTVKYSAFSYGYRTQMSSTSTTQLINVTRAMYWYWEAALNYKNANS